MFLFGLPQSEVVNLRSSVLEGVSSRPRGAVPESPHPYNCSLSPVQKVILVDLDHNRVEMKDSDDDPRDITPPLPEPQSSQLREALHLLLHPNLVEMDGAGWEEGRKEEEGRWGRRQNLRLRYIFLNLFAGLVYDYRDYVVRGLVEQHGTPNSAILSIRHFSYETLQIITLWR